MHVLQECLVNNKLRVKMQSAYRPCYSTETALLRAYIDLLLAVDKSDEAVLILFDYSAVFDTINHNIFPNILKTDVELLAQL